MDRSGTLRLLLGMALATLLLAGCCGLSLDRIKNLAATPTAVPPTATFTPLPPTATFTPLPPTATSTPEPPTVTPTPLPPTATSTPEPPTATPTPSPPPSGGALRYDGVYQSDKVTTYWYYIRFYPDGTVLTISATAPAQDLIPWLTRDRVGSPGVSIGQYAVDGQQIVFSATSERGTVDYEGLILPDALDLHTYSHINGHRGHRLYYFVPAPKR